jgi:hypothetical protein
MRETARGGGNRHKDSFGALSMAKLSAPIVFIAEAMESETALLERVVLVTIKRQPTVISTRNYVSFKDFYDNRDVLSVLGHNLAAFVTRTGSVESLRSEFDTIYNSARQKYLLQPGDIDILSDEEIAAKSNGRERVVFNTSVASFGFSKFESLLQAVFGDEYAALFGERMEEVKSKIYARMDDTAKSTMPEYLKVLLAMSDMSRLPSDNLSALSDGLEYQLVDKGGFVELHLATRISYAKYCQWLRSQGQSALYNGASSLLHSLQDAPQYLRAGNHTRQLVVDTVILDYAMLIRNGMPAFNGKTVAG